MYRCRGNFWFESVNRMFMEQLSDPDTDNAGRLQGCPRPEELCSLWNTVVGLTLSVHFVVIRVNFASEQLADVIAREAVSRHGGASDSYFGSGYPHHFAVRYSLPSSDEWTVSDNDVYFGGHAMNMCLRPWGSRDTCGSWLPCWYSRASIRKLCENKRRTHMRSHSVRTGKNISGSDNYLEHLEDCKTTLDSSEQTKSYADRRRSDLEFHKACPFEGFTMEGSNLFIVKRREPGLCRKTGCCTRKEREEATEQENRNH
ncbi:LOW QUALITY PROTEIN: hypothetical protein OSB04_012477 [Centaurea solstitialis]|uniref:Uncharacterized protein n=1 Tax=Centaurea solstitialis TaxID=347529 RepID=A0AA38TBG4_9ASTR|nr:LOW QUALITY PROTEIN: hypothetical protein OSB04_012477 [Centaurea solstitialis]